MDNSLIFNFKTDVSHVNIPKKLNNPFQLNLPEIVSLAAKEFQEFITTESQRWKYDFSTQKGKMFGVLVIQKADNSYAYLGTMSGNLPGNRTSHQFITSVFDDATDDFFINRGMTELTVIGTKIKASNNQAEIDELTEIRRQKSFALQQRLFENYQFSNLLVGVTQNVLQIFENSSQGKPPAGTGECVAPKLLQYAFNNQLKPIAIAEFWWGNTTKSLEREHKGFYPACKNKCRPILEFMLNDKELFGQDKY
jgi:tRNA pseudouridine32 synthase/23S rRNA pseudouridine746 synthase